MSVLRAEKNILQAPRLVTKLSNTTGRLLKTRIAEHAAAVRRNNANSQAAAHSMRPGHTFKFDEAEILARGDNRVSRELLESWFTGPQSIFAAGTQFGQSKSSLGERTGHRVILRQHRRAGWPSTHHAQVHHT
ncbi:unnamed protein product [Dibothriocephalus latus]|uniref:Uncharacterized protein n=1 Tax=Dibothriocephalus latus TaxID=60516 RepID=A0A3P6V9R5_DIBLA|nr:unnamed protein product [Dibothriocephalus latus]